MIREKETREQLTRKVALVAARLNPASSTSRLPYLPLLGHRRLRRLVPTLISTEREPPTLQSGNARQLEDAVEVPRRDTFLLDFLERAQLDAEELDGGGDEGEELVQPPETAVREDEAQSSEGGARRK